MGCAINIAILFHLKSTKGSEPVIDPELGEKRTCPECSGRFYDLGKNPIECPLCQATFVAEPILPSKEDTPPAEEKKPDADDKPATEVSEDDVEVVSLDDLDDDAIDVVEDDETAAIKDVDLGDAVDVQVPDADEDDTFLEVEDTGKDNVEDLIVKPTPDGDE